MTGGPQGLFLVTTRIDELDEEPLIASKIADAYGGKSLHEQSHGEWYFSLFLNRFKGDALYNLAEPEAALSPMRQMVSCRGRMTWIRRTLSF